jgi:hypothetical protein
MGRKKERNDGPVYFIILFLLGLILAYSREKADLPVPQLDFHGWTEVHLGYGLMGLGVLLLALNWKRMIATTRHCRVCGWTGPTKRWQEAGGCPICLAKKKRTNTERRGPDSRKVSTRRRPSS